MNLAEELTRSAYDLPRTQRGTVRTFATPEELAEERLMEEAAGRISYFKIPRLSAAERVRNAISDGRAHFDCDIRLATGLSYGTAIRELGKLVERGEAEEIRVGTFRLWSLTRFLG